MKVRLAFLNTEKTKCMNQYIVRENLKDANHFKNINMQGKARFSKILIVQCTKVFYFSLMFYLDLALFAKW